MQTPFLAADAPLDFVEELQLRRWARQNYVTPAKRPSEWHPIIREEMQLRDAEMIVKSRVREPGTTSAYVPLAPTELPRVHAAHPTPDEPNVPLLGDTAEHREYADYVRG